jgi:hypothetical protein
MSPSHPPREEGIDLSTMARERALRLAQMLALENAERMNDESLPSGIRYAAAVLREDCLEIISPTRPANTSSASLSSMLRRAGRLPSA